MNEAVPRKVLESLSKYPNYRGSSNTLKPRERNGRIIPGTKVVRVYVTHKVSERKLSPNAIIPKTIAGFETDVVIIGRPKALSVSSPLITGKEKIRPLTSGLSFGHWDITTGTLGWNYEKNGEDPALGSNAHVETPDPSLPPEEIDPKWELQPGPYHGGQMLDNKVGVYLWHKQLQKKEEESGCSVAWLHRLSYNVPAELGSRIFGPRPRTRQKSVVAGVNHIDFALCTDEVGFDGKVWQTHSPTQLGGHVFAGSDYVSILCKESLVIAESGWKPVGVEPYDFAVGDLVEVWSWRLTEFEPNTPNVTGTIVDEDANVEVGYGDFTAPYEHVVMGSPNIAKPGCSGSAGWKA